MSGDAVERRLAAILAADVAGYSRLMGVDEEGTLRALTALRRNVVDPNIAEHHGRIVKTTGDGMLVEFASVVDALRCAVEIQRRMTERNAEVPSERRIEFRIGINLGDVIIQGDDIFGDGVNIAARLEALALPGGICVSGVVREQVQDKLNFAFEDMAEQTVKNIARPIHVYRVRVGAEVARPPAPVQERKIRKRVIWGAAAVLALILIAAGAWLVAERSPVAVRFDEAKVRALAAKYAVPLPERIVIAPKPDMPVDLAAYLGAWGGDAQWNDVGRHCLLIVTTIDHAGSAMAIYAFGPPTPRSYNQAAAHYYVVTGRIDSDGLRFAMGQDELTFVVGTDGRIYGHFVPPNGASSRIVLDHIE